MSEPWKNLPVPPTGQVRVEYPEHDDERRHRLRQASAVLWMLGVGALICLVAWFAHPKDAVRHDAFTGFLSLMAGIGGYTAGRRNIPSG